MLLKKFPGSYGTQKFMTVFTITHHWFLFWSRWIQSTTSHPMYLRSILMSSHLCLDLPSGLFP